MSEAIKILGLGGSSRANSASLSILKIALQAAATAGATTELLNVAELKLPFFQPEQPLEVYPDPVYVRDYLAKFQAADGFLWCAPTYHGTPAAAFKNALDFLELLPRRPNLYLTGKVAGVLVVAGGVRFGPMSLNSLMVNAQALRLLVAPTSFAVAPAKTLLDQSGQLTDEKMTAAIRELGGEVVRLAQLLKTKAEK